MANNVLSVEITGNNASLKKSLDESKAALQAFKKQVEGGSSVVLGMTKSVEKEIVANQKLTQQLTKTKLETAQLTLEKRKNTTAVTAAAGSYREAQQRLTALGKSIREAKGGFDATNPAIKAQIEEYARLNSGLKAFDQSLGNHQRNVGNYGLAQGGANGVAMEFNRIIQDAPFGMIGIGNNIQQLTANWQVYSEQAKKAAVQTGATVTTASLAKGALSSLISPANLLTLGIAAVTSAWTFYTMWSQKANKANKEVKESTESYIDTLQGVAKASADGQVEATKELSKLKLLYDSSQNLTLSLDARKKSADELIKQYPDQFKGLTTESILAGKASEAYDKLTKSITATAMAAAYSNKITENSTKQLNNYLEILEKQNEANKLTADIENKRKLGASGLAAMGGGIGASANAQESIALTLASKRAEIMSKINSLGEANGKITAENKLLQENYNKQIENGADLSSGGGKKSKKGAKGKTQAEIIKEADEALATTQIGAIQGIDADMAKIDDKWSKIYEKINLINNVGLRNQRMEVAKLANEQEKYLKFLDAFAKSPSKAMGSGVTGLSGSLSAAPTSLPGLANDRIRRDALSRAAITKETKAVIAGQDELSKYVTSSLRRGISQSLNGLVDDLTSLGQKSFEIEAKYNELRKDASEEQIKALNKMEKLEKKVNNGFTNMLQSAVKNLSSVGANMLTSSLSEGISKGDLSGLSGLFKGDKKAMGYGALGSLAGGIIQGSTSPKSYVGQGLGGALAGAGVGLMGGVALGAAAGSIVPVVGTIVGAAVGAIVGIIGASKANKQYELEQLQLAEQKKQTALAERLNALAYSSSIIGQMTNQGIVNSIDVDAFGNLIAVVKGSDIQLVLDRNKNSLA